MGMHGMIEDAEQQKLEATTAMFREAYAGYGRAVRQRDAVPFEGEPYMSMDDAADVSARLHLELVAANDAALKPFSDACTISTHDDSQCIDDTIAASKITWGHLRAARSAFARTGGAS